MVLEQSQVGTEGRLPLIAVGDADEMEGVSKIDFAKDGAALNAVKEIAHDGERIAIFLRDSIESPIVDAESEAAILFLSEQDGRGGGGCGAADELVGEVF